MVVRDMLLAASMILCFGFAVAGAQDFDNVEFKSTKVAGNIYMLQGAGGNIGLFLGSEGVFLIDDEFAPLHEKLMAQIEELAGNSDVDLARTFLINTHYHHDHTGGNELMGESGAVIVAQANVRKRLSVDQAIPFLGSTNPALKHDGLPLITFTDDLTFHLNGDSVHVIHVGPAHTDGDAIVQFTKANVIHSGDIVFTNSYPFIDLDNGGSVAGELTALQTIIDLSDNQTKIIPGHGDLIDKAGVTQILAMLKEIYSNVSQMIADGKTLEQIQAAKPTQQYDAQYNGFMTGEKFVGFIYAESAGM